MRNVGSLFWAIMGLCIFIVPLSVQGAEDADSGVIKAEYSEVHSGPGAFYTSRGRVYRDDTVKVVETSSNGRWLKVRIGGLQGWVLATALDGSGDGAKPSASLDTGRDRKTTNYDYDKRGRRLDGRGGRTGTGEGTAVQPDEEKSESADARTIHKPASPKAPTGSKGGFSLRVGLGLALTDRVFSSNIENSPLNAAKATPLLLGLDLGLGWRRPMAVAGVRTQIGLELLIQDRRFGEVTIPIPADPEPAPVAIKVEGQRMDATIGWLYLSGAFAVGPYGGVQVFRSAYQETENLVFFLSTQILAAITGVELVFTHPRFVLGLRGAYLMPLSVSQNPFEAGEATGSGYQAQFISRLVLTSLMSIYVNAAINRYSLDFDGGGTHRDPVADEDYDLAREVNRFIDLSAGVQMNF